MLIHRRLRNEVFATRHFWFCHLFAPFSLPLAACSAHPQNGYPVEGLSKLYRDAYADGSKTLQLFQSAEIPGALSFRITYLSMTCTTPFATKTSAVTTLAPFTMTPPFPTVIVTLLPLTVFKVVLLSKLLYPTVPATT